MDKTKQLILLAFIILLVLALTYIINSFSLGVFGTKEAIFLAVSFLYLVAFSILKNQNRFNPIIRLNKKRILLLICLSFFLFFSIFLDFDKVMNQGDNIHHINKSRGNCCEEYPPFFSWISSPFDVHPKPFFLFSLFIITFAMPLTLYFVFKKVELVWFYFTLSHLPYYIITSGSLPSFLAIILWLFFYKIKNVFVRVFFLLLALLVHNSAIFLLIATWILELLFQRKEGIIFSFSAFPYYTEIKGTINSFSGIFSNFLRSVIPIASIFGFLELAKQKRFFELSIIFVSLVGTLLVDRLVWPSQIFLLYGFTLFFEKQNFLVKLLFIGLSITGIVLYTKDFLVEFISQTFVGA